YNLYKESGEPAYFDEAIAGERKAVQAWKEIVVAAGDVYSENLAFGAHAVGFRRHWKEELGLLQQDFDARVSERANVIDKPVAKPLFDLTTAGKSPPAVDLPPSGDAEPGRDLRVSAKVTASGDVKWMRLRYRHLSQYEDYLTADMILDGRTGVYTASIPGSFIDPRWDVMYFVEVVGKNGAGRMYPDLEQQAPYVIVHVKRSHYGIPNPVALVESSHWTRKFHRQRGIECVGLGIRCGRQDAALICFRRRKAVCNPGQRRHQQRQARR